MYKAVVRKDWGYVTPIFLKKQCRVVNVCFENDLNYDPSDIIITSWMPVSKLDVNVNVNKLPLAVLLENPYRW